MPALINRSMTEGRWSAKKGERFEQTISPTETTSTGASSAILK
ncbi:hypothetical protein ABIF90_009555 [Bradyrhizobium japonicum]